MHCPNLLISIKKSDTIIMTNVLKDGTIQFRFKFQKTPPLMYYATFAQKIQYLSEFFDRLSLAMQRKDEKEETKEENKKSRLRDLSFWWRRRDSNPRPLGCEPNALTS